MGCCASTQNSPYPAQQPNSSSRAIASQSQSQSALPRPSTSNSNAVPPTVYSQYQSPRAPRAGSSLQPGRRHATAPIKPPKKWATKSGERVWTRETLDSDRIAFFETRVTGRPEIWQAIQLALQVLWAGGGTGEQDGGLATAQGILDAAGITVERGDLTKLLYDPFGRSYEIERHVVSDPQNLAPSSPLPKDDDGDKGEDDKGEDEESEELDEEQIIRRREEKGKAVVNEADQMHATVRFSEATLPDREISFAKDETVRSILRRLKEEINLTPTKKLRFTCMGKMYQENKSLLDNGWNDRRTDDHGTTYSEIIMVWVFEDNSD